SPSREGEQALATVRLGRPSVDQTTRPEGPEDPAQVAGVETKFGSEGRGRGLVAVSECVQNPGLGQGERTLQQPFPQRADLPGVEAVESPHGLDVPLELGTRSHGSLPVSTEMSAFVKYLFERRGYR